MPFSLLALLFIGNYFPVSTHCPLEPLHCGPLPGLGTCLSTVTCVFLISPLHGVGFMVSIMVLSEKNLPILQGPGGRGGFWTGFGSPMATLVFLQGPKG